MSSDDTILSFPLATLPLQNSRDRLQVVGFQSLARRSARHGQYFSAHCELLSYDTFENLWIAYSEKESKMRPQNAWHLGTNVAQLQRNSIFWVKHQKFIIEPQKRVFVVETRATRRWNRQGSYFPVLRNIKYVHTKGTSRAHSWHTQNWEISIFMKFSRFSWIHSMCRVYVQILYVLSYHLKLLRVDLEL